MRATLFTLLSLATLTLCAPPSPPAQHPLISDSLITGYTSLTSLLTASRQSSLFYDYLRTAAPASLHAQLSAPPPAYTTLLVPTNQAILALARRPHQGAPGPVMGEVGAAVVGSREDEEAREAYLGRWIERHAVRGEVELEGEGWEGRRYNTIDGKLVWFELSEDGETRLLQPGAIEVVGVESVSRLHSPAPSPFPGLQPIHSVLDQSGRQRPAVPPRRQPLNRRLIIIAAAASHWHH